MRPDAQHLDAIPDSLYPEFQKQAMSGEDISNFNFGFMNHKGQFLNREDALDYAIKEGLVDKSAGQYGALTSTMEMNKVNDFIPAVKDLNTNKIYSGDKNSNHPSLKYQNNKFLNNISEGFTDKSGNFLTRSEFNNKFGINESSDLRNVLMSDSSKPGTAIEALVKDRPDLSKYLADDVPPKPGTSEIPEGSVRLYHQTFQDALPDIAKNGIQLSKAKGIEGPRAIYADDKGFYGKPGEIPTVEFHIPKDRWQYPPFVRADSVLDNGMVAPSNISAIHMPWHSTARYIESHPDVLKKVLSGEHDDLIPEKNYGTAIKYIKNKYKENNQ
jgi:hypothetical protein